MKIWFHRTLTFFVTIAIGFAIYVFLNLNCSWPPVEVAPQAPAETATYIANDNIEISSWAPPWIYLKPTLIFCQNEFKSMLLLVTFISSVVIPLKVIKSKKKQ